MKLEAWGLPLIALAFLPRYWHSPWSLPASTVVIALVAWILWPSLPDWFKPDEGGSHDE